MQLLTADLANKCITAYNDIEVNMDFKNINGLKFDTTRQTDGTIGEYVRDSKTVIIYLDSLVSALERNKMAIECVLYHELSHARWFKYNSFKQAVWLVECLKHMPITPYAFEHYKKLAELKREINSGEQNLYPMFGYQASAFASETHSIMAEIYFTNATSTGKITTSTYEKLLTPWKKLYFSRRFNIFK